VKLCALACYKKKRLVFFLNHGPNQHWTVLVGEPQEERFVHLDMYLAFGAKPSRHIEHLRRVLKRYAEIYGIETTVESWRVQQAVKPSQQDPESNDCALYSILFASALVLRRPLGRDFITEDCMANLRIQLGAVLHAAAEQSPNLQFLISETRSALPPSPQAADHNSCVTENQNVSMNVLLSAARFVTPSTQDEAELDATELQDKVELVKTREAHATYDSDNRGNSVRKRLNSTFESDETDKLAGPTSELIAVDDALIMKIIETKDDETSRQVVQECCHDAEQEEEEDDDDDDDDEAMPEAMPDEIDEGEDEPEEEDKEDEAMPEAMPNEFDEGEDEPEEEVEEDEAISEAMPDEDEEAEDESEEEDEAMPNEIDEEDEAMPNEIDEEDEAMPNEIDEEDEAMPNEIDEELYGQEQEEYEPDEDEEAEDEPDEEDPASNTALSQEEGAEAEKHSRKHRKSLGLLNGGAAVAAASNSQTNPTKPKSSPRSSSQQKSKASQKRQELFKATEVFLGQKKQDAINNQIDAMTDLLRTRLQNANFQQRKTALKSLVSLVAEVGTVSTVEQAISCFDRSVATNQRGATNQRVATTQMTVVSSRSRAEVTMTPRDEVAFSMALPTSWLVVEDNLDTIKRSLQACLHPEIYSELEPRLRSSSILCCRVFAHGFIQPWTVTGKSPIAIDTNDDGLFYVGQTRLELNAEIGNYDGKQLGPEAAFSYRPSGHYVMSQVCCPKVEEWTSEIQSAWENSDDNNPLIPIDLYVDGNGGVCGAMYKMNDGQHNLIPIAQRQTNNVKLCEDGLCRAIQEVTPGTELTTSYNLDKSPRTRAKRRKRLSTITTRNSRQKQPAMAQSDDERSDITQTNNDLSRRMELAQDSESKDADEQNLGSTADNEAQQMTEDVDMDNEVDDQSSDNLEEEPAPKRSRHSIPAKTVVNNNSGTEDVDISLEASDDNGVSPAVVLGLAYEFQSQQHQPYSVDPVAYNKATLLAITELAHARVAVSSAAGHFIQSVDLAPVLEALRNGGVSSREDLDVFGNELEFPLMNLGTVCCNLQLMLLVIDEATFGTTVKHAVYTSVPNLSYASDEFRNSFVAKQFACVHYTSYDNNNNHFDLVKVNDQVVSSYENLPDLVTKGFFGSALCFLCPIDWNVDGQADK